jgi:hypothetical protein
MLSKEKHDSENPFSSYRNNVRQGLKGPEEKLRGRGFLSPEFESAGQTAALWLRLGTRKYYRCTVQYGRRLPSPIV